LALSQSPLKLPPPVWLIIGCAVAAALLWTPGAPLVKAILIVLPGFVLDRLKGGPGIIGGLLSSAILGVAWGISQMEFSVSDAPALYFILVLSLMWGGLVSVTLYWVIKTYREHRQRVSAAGHPKMQFTLGQLMGLIAVCALGLAALSTPFALFVVAIGIVVPGFTIDRFRGGAGILGAMTSASVALLSLGGAVYVYSYLNADSVLLDYLGSAVLTLLMLGIAGVVWGALVGTVLDVALLIAKSYSNAQPSTDDGSPPIVWIPDEKGEP
jgi:hypothetical protein